MLCHRPGAPQVWSLSCNSCSTAQRGAPRLASERGAWQQISSRAAHKPRKVSSPTTIDSRMRALRRPDSCTPSPTRSLLSRVSVKQSSGERGVVCCSSKSLSAVKVSAPSTTIHPVPQHASLAAARTYARQNLTRSHALSQTLTCALSVPSAGAGRFARRARGEAAGSSAPPPRHLLRLLPAAARRSRSVRRLRRVDRCSSLTRPCVGCPRLGSLAARSRLVCALLPPLLRSRLPIPLEWASSSRGGALASCSVRPCGRARPVRHSGCSACLGRPGEHKMCDVVARWDHPRVGALGGGQ